MKKRNKNCHSERNPCGSRGKLAPAKAGVERRISFIPVPTKVFPVRICCLYKFDYFIPQPSIETFLSGNGRTKVTKRFKVNQPGHVIFWGKAFYKIILMLENSFLDVISHSDVKRSGFVCHNINIVLIVILHFFHCNINYIRWPYLSLPPSLKLRWTGRSG